MAATMREVVVGVFEDTQRARDAISALRDAGFSGSDISVLMPDRGDTQALAADTGTEAGEGAATGLVAGGILGGVAGWLVGIGSLAIPGVGPFIAAGVLGTTIAGAAIGAGVGVIAGALIGMGIPKEEADWYENEVKSGRTLIAVRAGTRQDEAEDILHRYGAYDVEHRDAASYTPRTTGAGLGTMGTAGMTTGAAMGTTGTVGSTTDTSRTTTAPEDAQTIRLREEQLTANKQRVKAGEVEVGKRVVEEQRSIDVPVEREEVVIERHPVNRRPADRTDFGDESETLRVPVMEEQVQVEKRPVVTEEVTVGKRETQDTRTVSGTVRREELDVDRQGDARMAGDTGTGAMMGGTWNDVSPRFRSDWQQRYGSSGAGWAEYEPRYRYGWEMANRPEYRGRSWAQAEPDLRRDYEGRYGQSTWDDVKDTVRNAWDSVTGQRAARS